MKNKLDYSRIFDAFFIYGAKTELEKKLREKIETIRKIDNNPANQVPITTDHYFTFHNTESTIKQLSPTVNNTMQKKNSGVGKKQARIRSSVFGSRGGSGSIDRAACQNSDKQVLQFLSMTAVTITKAFSLTEQGWLLFTVWNYFESISQRSYVTRLCHTFLVFFTPSFLSLF